MKFSELNIGELCLQSPSGKLDGLTVLVSIPLPNGEYAKIPIYNSLINGIWSCSRSLVPKLHSYSIQHTGWIAWALLISSGVTSLNP